MLGDSDLVIDLLLIFSILPIKKSHRSPVGLDLQTLMTLNFEFMVFLSLCFIFLQMKVQLPCI